MKKNTQNKIYFFFIFILFIYILSKRYLLFKKLINNLFNIIDISIILPIYNSEDFLSLCLNSIINQSYRNIEIICIDDGSTDKSLEIIRQYKNKDNRLIIIHQKNQGAGKARNKGIKISKGKFISFIDSDDLYPNNYTLENMFNKAINNKVLVCGGGMKTFIQYNKTIKLLNKTNILFPNNSIIKYYNYQYDYYFQRFIYNKNFIKKNKLYFPNYLKYQDPPFFIKTMYKAKQFYALKDITYLYRASNKTILIDERRIIDNFRGIKDCLFFSKSMHLYKLYHIELCHLNEKGIINKVKKFLNSTKLKNIISQIINSIDYELLRKENYTFIKNKIYVKLARKYKNKD